MHKDVHSYAQTHPPICAKSIQHIRNPTKKNLALYQHEIDLDQRFARRIDFRIGGRKRGSSICPCSISEPLVWIGQSNSSHQFTFQAFAKFILNCWCFYQCRDFLLHFSESLLHKNLFWSLFDVSVVDSHVFFLRKIVWKHESHQSVEIESISMHTQI